MLDAEQDEFIIAVQIRGICYHYATYLWQIDDEPLIPRKVTLHDMSMARIETGGGGEGYHRDRLPR